MNVGGNEGKREERRAGNLSERCRKDEKLKGGCKGMKEGALE